MTGSEDEGAGSGTIAKLGQALNWAYGRSIEGMPGVSGADVLAGEYLRSASDPEEAIDTLIKWQVLQASATGFVTGLGGTLTLPIAIPANMGAVLFLQLRMIAAVAHLRGYDLRSDHVKALAIACLLGTSAAEVVKEAGIAIGSKLTLSTIRRIPGRTIFKLNRTVGFRLLTKSGTAGVLNLPRIVPVVGGLVAGGIDAMTTRGIATAAKRLFNPFPPLDPAPSPTVR
ncbi:MAG TPA: EcsC family protein [Stellaceae bacterium]|nr:EcsC family protein [Stellaceae bacterium]